MTLLLLAGAGVIQSINNKTSNIEVSKIGGLTQDFVEVDGVSMEPTFHDGDIVYYYSDFTKNDIKEGSVVIFSNTEEDSGMSIKRVISKEGKVSIKDNVLYVNELKTPYGLESGYTSYYTRDNSWDVNSDSIFVLGDNYGNSIDSRTYGAIPIKSVIGIVKE